MKLNIDMSFELLESPDDKGEQRASTGTIRADGRDVEIYTDNPGTFQLGRSPLVAAVKGLAAEMARHEVTVSVSGPKGTIVSLGAVKASPAQRLLTKSRNIRLGRLNTLLPFLRQRQHKSASSAIPLPPGTPWPPVPTVSRNIRRNVTTTHYLSGGGRPRLILVRDSETWDGTPPLEFDLDTDLVTIGSAESSDLVLDGLDSLHARIVHTDDDEYKLTSHGVVGGSADGRQEGGATLRTGSRMVMGPWRVGFFREEYADHGRPFGGRNGGEFAHQKPQYNPRTRRMERDGSLGFGDSKEN